MSPSKSRDEGRRCAVGGGRGQAGVGGPRSLGLPAPLPRPLHKGAQGPHFLLAPLSRPKPVGSASVTAAGQVSALGLPRTSSGLRWGKWARVTRLTPTRPKQAARATASLSSPLPPTRCLCQCRSHRLPSCKHPPGRPGGSQAKAMATGWLLCLTAVPALLLADERGAGAARWQRWPQELQANPPLFFLTPPIPQHKPGKVSLPHWLMCPGSPGLDWITSGG